MLSKLGDKVRIVTQNVDGLHNLAGSKDVIELHGASRNVVCMSCGDMTTRADVQDRLNAQNTFDFKVLMIRPDGDVAIPEVTLSRTYIIFHSFVSNFQEVVENFQLVDCENCGGVLRPDIVFFGDNVPAARVKKVSSWVEECDSLLVVASSLTVYSAYRIVLQAKDLGKYIFIVNIGPTRGDKLANFKLDVNCNDLFRSLNLK